MHNTYSEICEGQQVVIRPEYRQERAIAFIVSVHGSTVETTEGLHHISDIADEDTCPESWLDEQALSELDLYGIEYN